jgi:hypothetical protein
MPGFAMLPLTIGHNPPSTRNSELFPLPFGPIPDDPSDTEALHHVCQSKEIFHDMQVLLKASTEPSLLQDEKGTHIEEALIPIYLIQTH